MNYDNMEVNDEWKAKMALMTIYTHVHKPFTEWQH